MVIERGGRDVRIHGDREGREMRGRDVRIHGDREGKGGEREMCIP